MSDINKYRWPKVGAMQRFLCVYTCDRCNCAITKQWIISPRYHLRNLYENANYIIYIYTYIQYAANFSSKCTNAFFLISRQNEFL